MKKLALIGCSASKRTTRARAGDLYTGALFTKSRAYAQAYCDRYAILSARYGFVLPEMQLEPYDETLKQKTAAERDYWAGGVLRTMREAHRIWPIEYRLVFLCGAAYVDPLVRHPYFSGYTFDRPLEGKKIGEAMQWLDGQIR